MISTSQRVVKNTGILYAKMGITMFISLYTTRLILTSLGAGDFGIFNIVGGAIAMLGFLNTAMAGATQRFMSYAEGAGDKEKQKSIFNISVILHFGIAVLLGIVLFVAGYFFFNGILNIPADRMHAAQMVYYFMIVSTMLTVMTVPYDAVLNAHENMLYYAIVGIIESVLKLAVAFVVVYTLSDKLIVYGLLMACISLLVMIIMRVYCKKNYVECEFKPRTYYDKGLMREMAGFAGWNFLGNSANVLTMQGVSLVINSFFGVLANAAQGVANQLSGQLMVFSNTMLKALNPVIVKSEGAKNRNTMLQAILTGSKLSFLMLAFFAIPFLIEMPYILAIWLKNPPDYAVVFCRLVLIRLLLTQLTITLGTSIQATGKIKKYTICNSIIVILALPISIVLYYLKCPIYTIYLVLIVMVLFTTISNIYFAKLLAGLKIKDYLDNVLITCFLITITSVAIGIIPHILISQSFFRLLLVSILV